MIEHGLQRLAEVVRGRAAHHDVEAIADDVLAQLHAEDSDDDLALVVVRLVP